MLELFLISLLVASISLGIFSLIVFLIHVAATKIEEARKHRTALLVACISYFAMFYSFCVIFGMHIAGRDTALFIIIPAIVSIIIEVIYLVHKCKKIMKNEKKEAKRPIPQSEPTAEETPSAETLIAEQQTKSEFSERSAFQDSRKEASKAQGELSKEQFAFCRKSAVKKAKGVLDEIQSDLLSKAKKADFLEKNGKRYVSAIVRLPFEYMAKTVENEKESLSSNAQMMKKLHYRRKIENAPGRKVTFSIEDSYAEEYKIFISELQASASYSGIKVMPMIYNDKKDESHTIPYVWEDTDCRGSMLSFANDTEESCILAAECVCEIPEKYSSDVPLFSDTKDAEDDV